MAREVLVRVTELSGQEFQLTLLSDDTILALRQKVSDQLRVPLWQLQLVHGAQILRAPAALLKDLGSEVEVLAIQNSEVLQRSRELLEFFSHNYRDEGFGDVADPIERHRDAICHGEVDFNFEGWNLVEVAIRNGHFGHVDLLLSSGASVNNESINGFTPLMACARCFCYSPPPWWPWRCSREKPKIVDTLLKHGADPNAKSSLDGSTPLLKACEAGCVGCNLNLAETLLKHGADPNAKSLDGSTPLLEAYECRSGRADILLKYGADPNAESLYGWTPMLQALHGGYMAKAFLKHGANPDDYAWLLEPCYDWEVYEKRNRMREGKYRRPRMAASSKYKGYKRFAKKQAANWDFHMVRALERGKFHCLDL